MKVIARGLDPLTRGRIAVAVGPLLGMAMYFALPVEYRTSTGEWAELSHAGRATLALLAWMVVWWMSEAVEVATTALLPLAVLPVVQASELRTMAAPYASDVVFLILSGFLMAIAMQRWGLDRRIALHVLRLAGTRPANVVAGCMVGTALMGGFISNTAKTAIMLPIGLSIITLVRERSGPTPSSQDAHRNFPACIVLGIAYSASISGVATLIGTPPNTFLAAFIRDQIDSSYRQEISFLQWLGIGLPLAAVSLPVAWLLLTRVLFPLRSAPIDSSGQYIRESQRASGPMNRGEWATFVVFTLTVMAWMLRPLLQNIEIEVNRDTIRPFSGLSDAGIAVIGALLLFVIPAGRRLGGGAVMDWNTAVKLPWGVLILFGGGLSLAAAIEDNGVALFLASYTDALAVLPPVLLVIFVTIAVMAFSEIASNTATAAVLVPILAAVAPGLGVHPFLLIFPATAAASLAFMTPIGTPPNAMALATGMTTTRQMLAAGFWMNLAAVILITLWTLLVVKPQLVH